MNKTLLRKWIWCFANERDSHWRKVISGKLGRIEVVGALEKLEVLLGLVCGRRSERNGIQPSLISHTIFSLEDGRRLRFWKDIWCGDEALCYSFPSIFSLAANKDILVANVCEEGGYSPSFTRPFND